MRIAILSAGAGWHVRDLARAAAARGHQAQAVDFRRLRAGVASGPEPLAGYDAVLVRTMPPGTLEQVIFRMDVLQRIHARGRQVLNPPTAIETCVDKYLASARLDAAGMRVPPTTVCQHAQAAQEAFERLGGDVVVKPLFGSEGRGMVRVTERDTAWRVFRTLERLQTVLYLQQFIPNDGWDVRALVLDGRVVAAIRRRSAGGWRTNVAQGGRAERIDLPLSEAELAIRAATALDAPLAGVDLLLGRAGWYVLEVNAVPGWRALAPVTGVDVAAAVVDSLVAASASS